MKYVDFLPEEVCMIARLLLYHVIDIGDRAIKFESYNGFDQSRNTVRFCENTCTGTIND